MSRTTKKWISLGLSICFVILVIVWNVTEQWWSLVLSAVLLIACAVLNNFGLCPYCCRPMGRHLWFIDYCPHCGHEL